MIPTDKQLNRAMAEAIGWENSTSVDPDGEEWNCVRNYRTDEKVSDWEDLPNYCGDRNALVEAWTKITQDGLEEEFSDHLHEIVCCRYKYETYGRNELFPFITAAPRLHVIAALKALARWPADWSSE